MRPLKLYLVGTGTWFLAFGLQGVMFSWLVTLVLRESPERVGLAQMALLLPGTLLILVGGSLADRLGGRRVVLAAQSLASLAPLILVAVIGFEALTFTTMLCYAVLMGTAQAFVTPARDGLLNQVAEGRVQRAVMLTSVIQFGLQIAGFALAALLDTVGAIPILAAQVLVLASGVFVFSRIHPGVERRHAGPSAPLLQSVLEGGRTVLASPSMRMIVVQNVAMALFFMGSFIVTMPLLVREVFSGTAGDLAFVNTCNSLGLVSSILFLLRFGDVQRQGRALVLAQVLGALVLVLAAFAPALPLFALGVFFWGVCGGVAMTMARTIMQVQAPESQRARIMAFYAFSFQGAGPLGALLNGLLVDGLGAPVALVTCGVLMTLVMCVVGARSSLWRLVPQHPPREPGASARASESP